MRYVNVYCKISNPQDINTLLIYCLNFRLNFSSPELCWLQIDKSSWKFVAAFVFKFTPGLISGTKLPKSEHSSSIFEATILQLSKDYICNIHHLKRRKHINKLSW